MYYNKLKDLKIMFEEVDDMFVDFVGSYVSVKMRDGSYVEGTVITIDNYVNLVIENDDGIHALKGGNVTYVSAPE